MQSTSYRGQMQAFSRSGSRRGIMALGAAGGVAADAPASLGLSIAHISSHPFHDDQVNSKPSRVRRTMRQIRASIASLHDQHERWKVEHPIFEYCIGGGLIKLHAYTKYFASGGGARGECKGFSWQSRRRLLMFLSSINRTKSGLPIFATLTYPGMFTMNHRIWKRDLDAFLHRLKRKHPEAFVVWKLEPQRRGAPHYHLLVFGVPHVDKEWLSKAWYQVVGSGDVRHLWAGTRVESVRSWRGVAAYAAKYLGKEIDQLPEGWQRVGRWWGVHNRKCVPIEKVQQRVPLAVAKKVRRVMRKFIERVQHRQFGRGKWRDKSWSIMLNEGADTLLMRLIAWAESYLSRFSRSVIRSSSSVV